MGSIFNLQQIINGLQVGSIYALIALGYTMVYGIVRLINFAHGDFFMIGAYAALGVFSLFNSWYCSARWLPEGRSPSWPTASPIGRSGTSRSSLR
jgi:branched-subunit amino acid ABC-type transport system permease component